MEKEILNMHNAGFLFDPEFDVKQCYKEIGFPVTLENEIAPLFGSVNGTPCLSRSYSQVNCDGVLKWIRNMQVKKKNIKLTSNAIPLQNRRKISRWFAWLRRDLVFLAEDNNLYIFYSSQIPSEQLNHLFEIIENQFQMEEFHNCVFYLDDYFMGNRRLLRLSDKNIDTDTHYNDDIKTFQEKITALLEPDDAKGLILFFGEPGNGQSTYLHYLTRILNRRFLYISKWVAPDCDIDNFKYIDTKRPLLILEDADTYVENPERSNGSIGTFVKDLLKGKITQKIQDFPVILTFSRPLSSFPKLAECDSGYIIAKYEFKPLALKKATVLATSLGKSIHISEDISLHDIFYS